WRAALENINVGDMVSFSGRFFNGLDGAVLTELTKSGGAPFRVADAYAPNASGTFAKPTVTYGGLTWMPIVTGHPKIPTSGH
ncbi:MAG TPA: hypothetical protein VF226_10215, partial [Hyphomicrobiaceae bacterium]